ncbi:arginine-hydroxylase NDUFAF5, mitochondrial isoform X2 [Phycodurus eques]|uniref:arginine-hydroxylase NDUFAF5, mitochondrial isoform X2 n=1 Tax=Phycodurus eques TaxID=693459 RepID=UPI002ACD28C2|nr:arginine-hydroxylase NDUFAF5, mitochondrial isoform X2 [Phycodurus eques]
MAAMATLATLATAMFASRCPRRWGAQARRSFGRSAARGVFDRNTKKTQKERAAAGGRGQKYDYVREEVGSRVADRVYDVARTFPLALEIGAGRGHVAQHLSKDTVERLFLTDISETALVCDRRRRSLRTRTPTSLKASLPMCVPKLLCPEAERRRRDEAARAGGRRGVPSFPGELVRSGSQQHESALDQRPARRAQTDPRRPEAGRRVHRRRGRRRDAVRAALLAAAGRDGARGGLLGARLALRRRHGPGEPAGTGRIQHAHRGDVANIDTRETFGKRHFRLKTHCDLYGGTPFDLVSTFELLISTSCRSAIRASWS